MNLKAPKVGVSFIAWLKIYFWLDEALRMLSRCVCLAIVLRGTVGTRVRPQGNIFVTLHCNQNADISLQD